MCNGGEYQITVPVYLNRQGQTKKLIQNIDNNNNTENRYVCNATPRSEYGIHSKYLIHNVIIVKLKLHSLNFWNVLQNAHLHVLMNSPSQIIQHCCWNLMRRYGPGLHCIFYIDYIAKPTLEIAFKSTILIISRHSPSFNQGTNFTVVLTNLGMFIDEFLRQLDGER